MGVPLNLSGSRTEIKKQATALMISTLETI
jgi:hypothetical protein